MHKTPCQQVKEKYTDKKKLIDAVAGSLKRKEGENKDQFSKRMARVSNQKLLRMAARAEKEKKK